MNKKIYKFEATINLVPDKGGAYIIVPFDIRKEFGKGRVKVLATFDGIEYKGRIVNMGLKDENNNICYIIGVLKSIRNKLRKTHGDIICNYTRIINSNWRIYGKNIYNWRGTNRFYTSRAKRKP